jgi:hypothetical protein
MNNARYLYGGERYLHKETIKTLCFNKLTQTTIISDKSMHGKTWRIDTTHTELLTMHEQSLLTSAM